MAAVVDAHQRCERCGSAQGTRASFPDPQPHLAPIPMRIRAPQRTARKWIDSVAGGGPDYGEASGPIKPLTKRDLQDRWAQHTQHCTACLAAMGQLRARAAAARAAAATMFAGLCAVLGTFGGSWAAAPLRGLR